jgi:outer membrane protein OmpA-like peptidoglycan-associated protein
MKHIIRSGTGALLAGMIAAGCSTTPPADKVAAADAALNNAGQAIDHAAADPHVAQYANTELDRANDSLGKAKEAWAKKHDVEATTHYAYMAQQRAATAQELANARAADNAVKMAAEHRDTAVTRVVAERHEERASSMEQDLAGFASGAARLPPNATRVIDQLVSALKENPGRKVVIEGHTDNVGKPKYNQGLALERAQAVRSVLIRHGIEADRITVKSLGEENPVASNDTSMGRKENRRAQVIIGPDTESTMVGSSQGAAATSSGQGEQPAQGQQQEQGQQPEQGQQSGQDEQKGQSEQKGENGQNGQDEQRKQ